MKHRDFFFFSTSFAGRSRVFWRSRTLRERLGNTIKAVWNQVIIIKKIERVTFFSERSKMAAVIPPTPVECLGWSDPPPAPLRTAKLCCVGSFFCIVFLSFNVRYRYLIFFSFSLASHWFFQHARCFVERRFLVECWGGGGGQEKGFFYFIFSCRCPRDTEGEEVVL